MVGPFFFAFGAFLLFWALNIFFLAADYIINQHAPFFLVLRFVVFRIPQAIPMAFPFACLFAALLAMGRVMGDNEVTAMRTAGISVMRIALAPLLFGFVMFAIAYAMNEWVAPASVELSTRTFYQIIYHTDALAGRTAVLPQGSRYRQYVFYVGQVGAGQPDDDGRADFQAGEIRSVERNAPSEDGLGRGRAALVLHDVIDTRYNDDGFVPTSSTSRTSRSGFRSARRHRSSSVRSITTRGR